MLSLGAGGDTSSSCDTESNDNTDESISGVQEEDCKLFLSGASHMKNSLAGESGFRFLSQENSSALCPLVEGWSSSGCNQDEEAFTTVASSLLH